MQIWLHRICDPVGHHAIQKFGKAVIILSHLPEIHETADELNIADRIVAVAVNPVRRNEHIAIAIVLAMQMHRNASDSAFPLLLLVEVSKMSLHLGFGTMEFLVLQGLEDLLAIRIRNRARD